jgi:hypothetical protein
MRPPLSRLGPVRGQQSFVSLQEFQNGLNPDLKPLCRLVHWVARIPQRCGSGDQIGSVDQYQTLLPLYPFARCGRS